MWTYATENYYVIVVQMQSIMYNSGSRLSKQLKPIMFEPILNKASGLCVVQCLSAGDDGLRPVTHPKKYYKLVI